MQETTALTEIEPNRGKLQVKAPTRPKYRSNQPT